MPKDYYNVLGLSRGATTEEVKAAFRRLAMEHHPDKGGNAEKFKEANEAYQVLSDPERREHYDRFGTVREGTPGFGGFGGSGAQGFNVNFEDLGDIFGGLGDLFGMGNAGRTRERGGRHIEVDARINFSDSVFGVEYPLELMKPVRCGICGGSGGEAGSQPVKCQTCNGSGRMATTRSTMFGVFQTVGTCTTCDGTGRRFEKKCPACRGNGTVREKAKITVKIPAGISEGSTIRVAHEGEAGERGAPAGDLFVHVRVKLSANFTRQGYDIVSETRISFADAALGTAVPVETVDGRIEVKIPAGTQPGTVLKLRNRGVPHLRSADRGDHLVTVTVEVPKKLSKKQKQLLEELRREG